MQNRWISLSSFFMNCLMRSFTSFSQTNLLKILNWFVVSLKHYTNWNNHFECNMKSLKIFSNHWVLNSSILTTTCSSTKIRKFTSSCMWMIFWSLMKIWITLTKSRANWTIDSKCMIWDQLNIIWALKLFATTTSYCFVKSIIYWKC